MSIDELIDASVRCSRCGTKGFMKCGCTVRCECGWLHGKDDTCRSPAHTPEARQFLNYGYWVISDQTGRPYKTSTASLRVIRERMEQGTIFSSRKEAFKTQTGD